MPRAARKRKTWTWLLFAAFLVFMGVVVYRSLQVAGHRCTVCLAFGGRDVCRTVEGPTEEEARRGALTNACAYLASGVTDSLACERTKPTKMDCTAVP